ncbi:MAG: hypothetical protein KA099_12295 [Alphaproteobacteria bacterium]|nr:hypothetical protein [Alphaproteobacteria bacterium]MBP7906093.1 hypothetical protein [Alphaproteobacteria bacterium]
MEYVYPVLIVILSVYVVYVFMIKGKKKPQQTDISYADQVELQKSLMLNENNTATLPKLDPGDYGYRAVGKEVLIAVQENAKKLEYKSTGQYKTRGASFSIPIVKGVRYRFGSGSIKTEKSLQVVAEGRLLLTDKAVIFESLEKNERITWAQISDIEVLLDGFRISKRSGPSRLYATDYPNPQFAAALDLLKYRAA